jgi:hypothetical protein
MKGNVVTAVAVGRLWWALIGLVLTAAAIWSVVQNPPFPWWAVVIAVLALLSLAQFLHAQQLAREIAVLRTKPEQVAKEWDERLRRELRGAADSKSERRRKERREERNQLQGFIDRADRMLHRGHTSFRIGPVEWAAWVSEMEWWGKEVLIWLELQADAPEVAKFNESIRLPRISSDSPNAPYEMHTDVLILKRDRLREILAGRFPPID